MDCSNDPRTTKQKRHSSGNYNTHVALTPRRAATMAPKFEYGSTPDVEKGESTEDKHRNVGAST